MLVILTMEKETKNTVRFAEGEEQPAGHPGAPVIGTMYIQKFAWAQMGKPDRVAVQLEPVKTGQPAVDSQTAQSAGASADKW
jgi:hypothetical protein